MAGPDREKQERLLTFVGWLHDKHRWQTVPHGGAYTEVRFTREQLGDVPALASYSIDHGDAGDRALYRDIEDLRPFGIDVRWEGATQKWVSRAAPLTDDECRALATAALYVLVEEGSPAATGYHIPGAGLSVEGAELVVAYAPAIDLLVEAIRTRRRVQFRHRGVERTVEPWHVFMLDGRWYLVGHDELDDDRRAVALSAIEEVEYVGNTAAFQIPRVDWSEYAGTISNPDQWSDHDPVEVTIVVDPRLVGRAEIVLGAVRTGSNTRRGWVEMSCRVRNIPTFIDRLWALRARAVVTSPLDVRNTVVSSLEAMI